MRNLKKFLIVCTFFVALALLAGCGSKNKDNTNDNNTPNNNQTTELSGSVATNGSTSMEKVIGRSSATPMAAESPGRHPMTIPMVVPAMMARMLIGVSALKKPPPIKLKVPNICVTSFLCEQNAHRQFYAKEQGK